jgi:hypothetical protein
MVINYSLNDREIRSFLIEQFSQTHASLDTVLIEELDLCVGEARIDLALINGKSQGIEIKSDCDTLDRLPKQIEVYSKVFDRVDIVSGSKLLKSILPRVPDWWGVARVTKSNQGILKYNRIRNCRKNPSKDPLSNAQLLWKNEILDLFKKRTLDTKFKYKSKEILLSTLVENFSHTEVFTHVNFCLRNRKDWRFVHRLM